MKPDEHGFEDAIEASLLDRGWLLAIASGPLRRDSRSRHGGAVRLHRCHAGTGLEPVAESLRQ